MSESASRFRVLVVDDDPDMGAYLSLLLRKEGMHAEEANDGEKALARVPGVQKVAVNLATESAAVEGAVCAPGGRDRREACDRRRPRAYPPPRRVAALVEVVVSDRARAEGANGMAYAVQDEQAARALPGPAAHAEIAAALVPVLRGLL